MSQTRESARSVATFRDPGLSPSERHLAWLDHMEVRLAWGGLIAAVVLSVFVFSIAALLVLKGHGTSGTVLGSVDLVALATVFITGGRSGVGTRR